MPEQQSDTRTSETGGFRDSFRWDVIRSTPRYAYLVAGVAAIGGMLFGYDIGVISGAENLLKAHWHLSAGSEELAVSAVLIGAIIGGIFGGKLADTGQPAVCADGAGVPCTRSGRSPPRWRRA